MKNKTAILLGGFLLVSNVHAQDTPPADIPGIEAPPAEVPQADIPAEGPPADIPAEEPPADLPNFDAPPVAVDPDADSIPNARGAENAAAGAGAAGAAGAADVADVADVAAPAEEKSIAEDDGGFLIKDANINDIFQLLARRAGKQYFHNNQINTDDFLVTGHLNGDTSPLKQMEELAFQYGLRMYVKGNTVYAMRDDQLDKLPAKEWTYQLRYLRPTDIEQIRALIQPLLTAGRGIVNFEPKTNTIVIIDTMHHIESVERVLKKIDQPKGQIVVEVKILNVNSTADVRAGVNWSTSLGASGVSVDIVRSLNSVFGLGTSFAGAAITGGSTETVAANTSNIILTPLQLSGVLRALNEGNLVTQKSNPVVITEDNERAIISLIDRVPIITSTVNNTGNGISNTTDEVRYTVDESDSTEPETTREIGVTIAVTPSLLPDGTIRMNMRPRNAQIVENITGASGNVYPRVSESTIQSIARIPDGNSLIVGGFYGETKANAKTKVPLLGDVPVLRFFFKSKETNREASSLVFVVTPTSYDPACVNSTRKTTNRINAAAAFKPDYNNVDPRNPGAAHKSDLRRTIRGMRNQNAPDNYPQR